MMWNEIEDAFRGVLREQNRTGVIAAVPLSEVRLLPEQHEYVRQRLEPLGLAPDDLTALSFGISYEPVDIGHIPGEWLGAERSRKRWNLYSAAYHDLNARLLRMATTLAERFGGVAEGPTRDGVVGTVSHVRDYFPGCISHRAVAETAGLGWRGRHGLIVSPEFGPALRLSTVFLPFPVESPARQLRSCGDCRACLDVCPILDRWATSPDPDRYREACRRRIAALRLEADVCGICVRRCWEAVKGFE